MARILTGIQSSGKPHLGNILGAIKPAIKLTEEHTDPSFLFIADLHSMTTIRDPEERKNNTMAVVAAYIACGLDYEKNILYRQSAIPEVCELTWYLNCMTPYPMLANAHSFKDKKDRLSDVNAGLFTYPVLMAADILLYSANIVPVGKDQVQHLEITRDIATAFNNTYGEILTLPEVRIDEQVMVVPGVDGQKMSKSYKNTIDIFQEDKPLEKSIKKILSDSTPLEDPKDPENDVTYKLYSLIASEEQKTELAKKYRAGNYGYGHAKKEFYTLLKDVFKEERRLYKDLINDKTTLSNILDKGENRAREIAKPLLAQVRQALGF